MVDEKMDYLEVDQPIPGQNYCCISFVSPDDLIESKEAWKVSKFLQSVCKDKDMEFKKIMEQYNNFCYKFQDDLQKDFDQQNNFKTNIRGVKIRGTYNTKEEAVSQAKKLQTIDSDFHVFVGQVGYWLPWDPCADKVEDEQFMDSQLNEMMEKYKENSINKDVFYEEQKREKIKAAREEIIRKKKEKELEEKELEEKDLDETKEKDLDGKDLDEKGLDGKGLDETKEKDLDETKEKDLDETKEKDLEPEEINEVIGNDKVDDDIKHSLESIDPWMANKIK